MKLSIQGLSFRYSKGSPLVLSSIDLEFESASYWCVAGPNGSGKSTLLKLACQLLPPAQMQGSLSWDSRPLAAWTRLELARQVAFVPSFLKTRFSITVEDFVLQGRYAHSPMLATHSRKDRAVAEKALSKVGIAHLAGSSMDELSVGQAQLSMIARALAQEPRVMVLDESTSNLDMGYQALIFGLLAKLNAQGMTVLVVTHDLNLAAEFCPNVVWLSKGALHKKGPMVETLSSELLYDLYGMSASLEVGKNPYTGRPKIFWKH